MLRCSLPILSPTNLTRSPFWLTNCVVKFGKSVPKTLSFGSKFVNSSATLAIGRVATLIPSPAISKGNVNLRLPTPRFDNSKLNASEKNQKRTPRPIAPTSLTIPPIRRPPKRRLDNSPSVPSPSEETTHTYRCGNKLSTSRRAKNCAGAAASRSPIWAARPLASSSKSKPLSTEKSSFANVSDELVTAPINLARSPRRRPRSYFPKVVWATACGSIC